MTTHIDGGTAVTLFFAGFIALVYLVLGWHTIRDCWDAWRNDR